MISRALNVLGLIQVSEHEAFVQTSGVALANSEADLKKAEKHLKMALEERESARAQRGEAWATIKTQADEIERLTLGWNKCGDDLKDMTAKFKLAATDLAKQAEEIKRLTRGWDNCGDELNQVKRESDALQRAVNKLNAATDEHLEVIAEQDSTIEALRHDANMWRNSLKRSRDRKKGVGK